MTHADRLTWVNYLCDIAHLMMNRYRALNPYLKEKFGERVYKVTLDINGTCPNRDGSKGHGGCIYCNPNGGLPLTFTKGQNITDQLARGIDYIRKRHKAGKFISYFQQHTNTYAPVTNLAEFFHQAIDHPDIVGLAVSTRPDCISNETLELLADLNKKTYLWVELGLQTASDNLLKFLNRGHTVRDFISCAEKLHRCNIEICTHIILGLPNETDEDIIKTIGLVNKLGVAGIKIHNLHVLKDTPLEKLYKQGSIELSSLDEYAKKTVFALERLDPDVLIHRFNSHAPRQLTIAPKWSINKLQVFNAVENELEKQDTWQGKKS